ncbi:MAG: hypothetical protein R3C68_05005 [Myxococcota bacterium]
MLAVIANKTGYPSDMLNLDGPRTAISASIRLLSKLAALQEKLPHAPVIKPEHLGRLQTLGQICTFDRRRSQSHRGP